MVEQVTRTEPTLKACKTSGNCERLVLQHTREDEEFHELWVARQGESLLFGEDSEGSLTELAFGESWHRSLLTVNAGALSRAFAGETPEAFLTQSDAPLCDLMDRLDWHAVPYRYLGLGSSGVVTMRNESQMMNFSQTLDESPAA